MMIMCKLILKNICKLWSYYRLVKQKKILRKDKTFRGNALGRN
jgi:hypothetical protein